MPAGGIASHDSVGADPERIPEAAGRSQRKPPTFVDDSECTAAIDARGNAHSRPLNPVPLLEHGCRRPGDVVEYSGRVYGRAAAVVVLRPSVHEARDPTAQSGPAPPASTPAPVPAS